MTPYLSPFFQKAVAYVLDNEGGYVNDPLDPGGATNFGITQATLASFRGEPTSVEDVKTLTKGQASIIYFERYWKPLSCPHLFQVAVATAIMDVGVLFGIQAAAVSAQRAARASGFPQLDVDGHVGPFTLNALNAVNPEAFLKAFRFFLTARIDAIIEKRPSSAVYKDGWCARVDRLVTLKTFGGIGA